MAVPVPAPPTRPARPLDLRLGELRELVAWAVGERVDGGVEAAGLAAPFGCYLFDRTEAAAELARQVERDVFLEAFGNTPELLVEEYGPYEHGTGFLCVIDHRRRLPVAAMRVLVPGGRLKTLDDLELVWGRPVEDVAAATGIALDPARTWDIATLAVDAEYRQGIVSQALMRAVGQGALRNGMEWVVTVLDLRVLRLVQGRTGRPFHRFRGIGPRRYLDSPSSLPVWLQGSEYRGRLLAESPELHALMFDPGTDPAVADADWDAQPAIFAGRTAPAAVAELTPSGPR